MFFVTGINSTVPDLMLPGGQCRSQARSLASKSGNNMLPNVAQSADRAGFRAHIGGFARVTQGAWIAIYTNKLTHGAPLKSATDRHMSLTDPVHGTNRARRQVAPRRHLI
jgi:hypothetical protein